MAEEFLKCFLSHDNLVRQAAEKQLSSMVSGDLLNGLNLLASGLQLNQTELAEMASVLICRFYIDREEVFSQINHDALRSLVTQAQQQLQKDSKLSYLKRMDDLVVKILLRLEKYDEMVQYVLNYSASNINQKLSLMYFIEIMCEFAFDDDLLVKHAESLNNIFQVYLNDSEPTVRVAALKSMTTFLSSIESQATLMKFQGAIPTLLQKCVESIQLDQESSISALQSVSDLLEHHPKFLQNSTSELINIYTEVMDNGSFLGELRRAALHGLQTLAHAAPVQVRKSDMFKNRTTVVIMKMLTEVQEKNQEWEDDLEDNCQESQEISAAAQDTLAKMSGDLTAKFMLPIFIKMIVPALQSKEWKDQHAGLVAMAMLCEGSAKYFQNDLDTIVQTILPLGQCGNTRVLYDTLTCFALLCQEFHPTIQKKYGQQVLSLVVACMQQNQSLKLKHRGTACLVDFCRELVEDVEAAQEVLAPHAQILLECLYLQINENLSNQFTQKESKIAQEALTALSALAASLKSHFAGFYDTLMPAMIRILQALPTQGDQYIDIRTLLIECMGFILGSISDSRQDQFSTDSQQLMGSFLVYQQTLLPDDQQHPSLFAFYTQVAQGMKSAFTQYLPQVFDYVERAIKLDLGFSVADVAESQQTANSKIVRMKVDLKFSGIKALELNTSALESKIEGAHILLALCESCGKSFAPYLQRTALLVNEYLVYKNSRDIRETMAKCVFHMMNSCSSTTEEAQVFNFVGEVLLKETQTQIVKGDAEAAYIILEQVSECVQLLKHPLISEQLINAIITICAQTLSLCKTEKQAILKEYAEEEQDVEQQEKLKVDYEDIDNLLESVVDICAHLAKYYKFESQLVNNIMPQIYELLVSIQSTPAELINCLAFFNSVLPQCSSVVFEKALTQIGQVYISKSNTTDLEMKQNILYGLGEFATKATTNQFSQLLPIAQQLTQSILGESDIKSESKINSYETAIATMGKIGLFQSQQDSLKKFVECLPLNQSDAQETHLMLLKQVELNNPALVEIKDLLLVQLKNLKAQDNNNPENEILCDEGRLLINKILC